MSTLLTNIGNVIMSLISFLRSVATALIGNEVFQIMLAVIIFKILFNELKDLNKNNNKKDLDYYKKDLENWIEEHPGAYEENGTWVYTIDEEINNDYEITDYNELMSSKYDDDEYDEYLSSLNGHNDI